MFTAFWDILTIDNLIYLFKGAMVSLSMAASIPFYWIDFWYSRSFSKDIKE